MMELIRRFGMGLIVLGVLLILVWAIEPLSFVWPWVRGLPLPIRVGVVAAAAGMAILLGSMITERFKERERDQSLREEP